MNRLQYETSPYLLQHKDNPVDWYAWGEEAFQKAQAEDKPVLLSVGYSACHWCHVMAHESFEDPQTAQMMNELFVNIKVDREERPDVDDIYMGAVQALTRQGGWPMTVFLFPDGRPFHGGTYFPPEPRHGMPSFQMVLESVDKAYRSRRKDLEALAEDLTGALDRDLLGIGGEDEDLNSILLDSAVNKFAQDFDKMYGGFGGAPKFPQPMNLEYLLRSYARNGDENALHMVTHTLKKMATGGIYDQIGGGFARYSVDAIWLIPHFEKMLYDNAQLSRLYLHAWQVTGDPFFRQIAEEIYDYILREMTAPEGGFYSATDADSEGEEGKFFAWTVDELREVLGEDVNVAVEYFGVSGRGNFEGKNVLYVPNEPEVVAERLSISVAELYEKIERIKHTLYAHRSHRIHPGLDDKILTAWNGMMLASLAEAARTLKRGDYKNAAERAGDFMLENLIAEDGRLYRTHKDGKSKLNGYLEDYANFIDALIELYQATYDEKWFVTARRLADHVLAHFQAPEGGFYDTSDDHESLIVRPRNVQDNATPSGSGMMAKQLLRLTAYTGDSRYEETARGFLKLLSNAILQYPSAFGESLSATDMLVTGIAEIALVGDKISAQTGALLEVINTPFRPNVIRALAETDVAGETTIPLLNYRTRRNGETTVYVCRNFACQMPVTTPEDLKTLLENNTV